MEICQDCGLPMKGREAVWIETKSAQYYSLDPFCVTCARERDQRVPPPERDKHQEHARRC